MIILLVILKPVRISIELNYKNSKNQSHTYRITIKITNKAFVLNILINLLLCISQLCKGIDNYTEYNVQKSKRNYHKEKHIKE